MAARHIDPVFLNSRIATSDALDAVAGCRVLAKVELENPIGSFKGRGTEWLCATILSPGETVVCASAGNFGQGLARAASRRGHASVVFASEQTNPLKIEAMRRFGADVRLRAGDFDAAKEAARLHAKAHALRFIEDGAEPTIAEGAGTIAVELLDAARFDAMIVPLGNGALLAGIGAVLRELAPTVEITAVVAQDAPAMKRSLEAGYAIETDHADTIADGIAVRVPIASTVAGLRTCCDAVIEVSEQRIFEAMQVIYRHLHLIVEPAGAVAVAAILANAGRFAGRRVATLLSGGNISPTLLRRLLDAPDPVDTFSPTTPRQAG
ncbi:MAG TPA: pyridoxal-phosphate dependent enzyme [Rhodanobacteraceae bacterium]|nr:pyridoxal-phosphate dependent enzyme [Rhodanobacteraceae bacterium]